MRKSSNQGIIYGALSNKMSEITTKKQITENEIESENLKSHRINTKI